MSNTVAPSGTRAEGLYPSLLKALRILDAFSEDAKEWRVTDLARETATSKSTVSRLLAVMEQAGYVRRAPSGAAYALALRFMQLGRVAQASYDLISASAPFMRELWRTTRGTVVLRVLEDTHLVTVAILESPEPVRISHPVGGRVAYNFGAYGKAVLSALDPALRQRLLVSTPLHRFTPRTIVDVARFRATLERVRADGYALSDEEGMAGTRAVAAPVWNYEQRVIGALGVSFPTAARDRAAVLALGPVVRDAAERLSVHLGARRGTTVPSAARRLGSGGRTVERATRSIGTEGGGAGHKSIRRSR